MTHPDLLDALVERCGLGQRREQIHGLVRPAMLLRSELLSEGQAAVPGASRLGGLPDLPLDVPWPRHREGRPLAFLAQVNLGEVGSPGIPGFPSTGLLSLFSVFGWRSETGGGDPFVWNHEPDPSWTRVLFVESTAGLAAVPPPEPVNIFPAASVSFRPHGALPTDEREPALAALGWPGGDLDAFEELVEGYHEVVVRQEGASALNLLGGYAVYQQGAVGQAVAEDMRLLIQVGSDRNAGMSWGDGGFLYVWIRPDDLAARLFDRVVVDWQCG